MYVCMYEIYHTSQHHKITEFTSLNSLKADYVTESRRPKTFRNQE